MKGRKGSQVINELMRDLNLLRDKNMNQMLMQRTHDILPMEDPSLIESQGVKYDCSLFMVGSTQKKRPDNLTLGRLFDGHVLDMFEVGVEQFKSTEDFTPGKYVTCDDKPILVFQGEPFETSEKHKRLKNLFIDMFQQRNIQMANIPEVRKVILFTCRGDSEPIEFRHLECTDISETTV